MFLFEGGATHEFMRLMFENNNFDVAGKHVLEIGPKHGLHTRFICQKNPASVTCVELECKRTLVNKWSKNLQVEFRFGDFLNLDFDQKYDLILFAGVIYHNIEQIRMLRKLRTLASDNCALIFESSCIRDKKLIDENVIQIFWPDQFRKTPTVRFMPSKRAAISMLEMAGWKIVGNADEVPELTNPERINLFCTPSETSFFSGYEEIQEGSVQT
jgi:hypothetical protein